MEDSWQPADFLPDSRRDTFFDEVKELREKAGSLSYDLLAVLIGDTITGGSAAQLRGLVS
ncbi:MAG: acyl-ACP desaturase [Hymenobacter sp.]